MPRPKAKSSLAERELDKAQTQFDNFESQVKALDINTLQKAPDRETEPQTKISKREANAADAMHTKPHTQLSSKEKFNDKFRSEYERAREYIKCIVENNEVMGEAVELWTKPYPGVPAQFWKIPVNRPVMIPRFVAQRISECKYRRLKMDESKIVSDQGGVTQYGQIVAEETKHRLDARPVTPAFTAVGF